MNKKKAILAGIASVGITLAGVAGLAFAQQKGVKTSNGNDLSQGELRAITLENWDKTDIWQVFTDKDSMTYPDNLEQGKYDPKLAPTSMAMREAKYLDGAYPRDVRYLDTRKEEDKKNLKVLGVKFQFTYSGSNEVTIRPPRTPDYQVKRYRTFLTGNEANLDRNEAKKSPEDRKVLDLEYKIYGIDLPGVAKALSVWVCGRGNDYDLEGWIEDYKGDTHIVKFGSVGFVGWRPMTAKIPVSIPQFSSNYPATRTAVFKQFKLRSNYRSSGDPVILFFDEFRVLTDTFEVHFDGANLDFDDEDCANKAKLDAMIDKRTPGDPYRTVKCGEGKGATGKEAPAPAKKNTP